jgi:guanosine-3',5'-bis(diphosphate) 3'-pyrophosphohydrolase
MQRMSNPLVSALRAADTAAHWHLHQRRKGTEEPYINHLLEVASLVARATEGNEPDLVIAALLHDSIEDQEVPRDVIAQAFSEDVAKLVEEVTDDKSLDEEQRKRLQIERSNMHSRKAKILKLADKTSNLKALAVNAPPAWSVSRQLAYVAWARQVADRLTGVSNWLERQFAQAANDAERSILVRD